jgi:transcriptional regulator
MYTPPLFREPNPVRLYDLIDAHPFGTLVVPDGEGGLEIAHVPFVLDRRQEPWGQLRVHVASNNPIWRLAASQPVVAVFHGPDAYVSPNWYEKPQEQVPTWNYAVVHAHGRATVMPPEETRRLVVELATIHEGDPAAAWRLENLDEAFAKKLLQQIVGLTIAIERLDGKFKLSQNRSSADRARVRTELTRLGGAAALEMAGMMEANEVRSGAR